MNTDLPAVSNARRADIAAAVISCGALGIICIIVVRNYLELDPGFEITKMVEEQKMAAGLYFSNLERIGQVSLVLTGLLWAFIFNDSYSISISNVFQVMIFSVANIFLLGSFASYYWSLNLVTDVMYSYLTFDMTSPTVEFYRSMQLKCFIAGTICLAGTIVLCRTRKKEKP